MAKKLLKISKVSEGFGNIIIAFFELHNGEIAENR
jgi:hypothetical protein